MPPPPIGKEVLGALSILLGSASACAYVRSMMRGETRPHLCSWLVWAIASGIAGGVQWLSGGGAGSWLLLINAAYSLGIALASLRYGTRHIQQIDWVVLAMALSAVPSGYFTGTPWLSSAMAIAVDAIAYIPTIRKSWRQPRQESALSWAISSLMFALSFAAQERYVPETMLYPAAFAVINCGLALFLLVRRSC